MNETCMKSLFIAHMEALGFWQVFLPMPFWLDFTFYLITFPNLKKKIRIFITSYFVAKGRIIKCTFLWLFFGKFLRVWLLRLSHKPESDNHKNFTKAVFCVHSCYNRVQNVVWVYKVSLKILIWSKSWTVFFGYSQQYDYKNEFLVRSLGTRLQFELCITFHPNSLIS